MYRALRALTLPALAIIFAGCSPIAYREVDHPDRDGLIKFNLQASAIVIDEIKRDEGPVLTVTSVPTESEIRYAINANDYFLWKTTHLNIEKYPNTDIIKSISIDTEDNRKEFITSAASIAVGVAAIMVTPKTETLPRIINTESLLKKTNRESFDKENIDKLNGKPVSIKFGKIPDDAINIKDFPFTTNSEVYAFSACRNAKISFNDGVTDRKVSVSIADPNFIQTIRIPEKGSITMHSGCGVDTKSEKSSVSSDADVLSHLVGQVKSALESKK